jgi:hypothetical protein
VLFYRLGQTGGAISKRRKRQASRRRKKRSEGSGSTNSVLPTDFVNSLNETYRQSFLQLNLTHPGEESEPDREVVPYEAAAVYGALQLTLTNLHHFQEYSIEVWPLS